MVSRIVSLSVKPDGIVSKENPVVVIFKLLAEVSKRNLNCKGLPVIVSFRAM